MCDGIYKVELDSGNYPNGEENKVVPKSFTVIVSQRYKHYFDYYFITLSVVKEFPLLNSAHKNKDKE